MGNVRSTWHEQSTIAHFDCFGEFWVDTRISNCSLNGDTNITKLKVEKLNATGYLILLHFCLSSQEKTFLSPGMNFSLSRTVQVSAWKVLAKMVLRPPISFPIEVFRSSYIDLTTFRHRIFTVFHGIPSIPSIVSHFMGSNCVPLGSPPDCVPVRLKTFNFFWDPGVL